MPQVRSTENMVSSEEKLDFVDQTPIGPSASEDLVRSQLIPRGTTESESFYTAREDFDDGKTEPVVIEAAHSFSSLFRGTFSSARFSDPEPNLMFAHLVPEVPRIPIVDFHHDSLASTPGTGGDPPRTPQPRRRRVRSSTPKQEVLGSPPSSLGSRRPLERSPEKRWTATVEGRRVTLDSPSNNSHPTNRRESRSTVTRRASIIGPDEKILKWQRHQVAAALENADKEDDDMEFDTALMHNILLQPAPRVVPNPEPRKVTPKPPALGPHGTELIEG